MPPNFSIHDFVPACARSKPTERISCFFRSFGETRYFFVICECKAVGKRCNFLIGGQCNFILFCFPMRVERCRFANIIRYLFAAVLQRKPPDKIVADTLGNNGGNRYFGTRFKIFRFHGSSAARIIIQRINLIDEYIRDVIVIRTVSNFQFKFIFAFVLQRRRIISKACSGVCDSFQYYDIAAVYIDVHFSTHVPMAVCSDLDGVCPRRNVKPINEGIFVRPVYGGIFKRVSVKLRSPSFSLLNEISVSFFAYIRSVGKSVLSVSVRCAYVDEILGRLRQHDEVDGILVFVNRNSDRNIIERICGIDDGLRCFAEFCRYVLAVVRMKRLNRCIAFFNVIRKRIIDKSRFRQLIVRRRNHNPTHIRITVVGTKFERYVIFSIFRRDTGSRIRMNFAYICRGDLLFLTAVETEVIRFFPPTVRRKCPELNAQFRFGVVYFENVGHDTFSGTFIYLAIGQIL